MCCSVVQWVAVCCSDQHGLHECAAVFCSDPILATHSAQSQRVNVAASHCNALRDTATHCNTLGLSTVCCSVLPCIAVCCSVLQCDAVCCSVLQWPTLTPHDTLPNCRIVCCSVLRSVAACSSVLQRVPVCSRDQYQHHTMLFPQVLKLWRQQFSSMPPEFRTQSPPKEPFYLRYNFSKYRDSYKTLKIQSNFHILIPKMQTMA